MTRTNGISLLTLITDFLNSFNSSFFMVFSLPLLNHFLVDHDNESTLRFFLSKFTAITEEYRYLINLDHNVSEEKLITVLRLLSFFRVRILIPHTSLLEICPFCFILLFNVLTCLSNHFYESL